MADTQWTRLLGEFFDPPELQLLYGLLPAVWGRGLATEAAAAACEFAFDRLGWPAIRAATDTPNIASRAVLGRLGFSLDRTTDDGAHGTSFYVLRRTDAMIVQLARPQEARQGAGKGAVT